MGKEKLILVIILGLAIVLRLIGISQSLWLDEAAQAHMSSLSLQQIWSGRAGDFHPPLFYLLAHVWMKVGHSEVWLRLLPVTLGVLTIPAIYLLAQSLFPKTETVVLGQKVSIGLVAAFILAINPFHVYYSQEFRMYVWVCLLATLSMWAFYKKHWSLFLWNTLLLYSHYTTIFLFLVQLVHVVIFARQIMGWWFVQSLLTITLYIPWVPQFIRQFGQGVNIDSYLPGWRSILTLDPLKAFPLTLFKLIAGRIDFISKLFYAVYLGIVLVISGVAVILAHQKRNWLLVWMGVPLLGLWAVSFAIPLNQPSRLIYLVPALVLIFSQAVMRFPRLFLLLLLYISIAGLVMTYTRPRLKKEQWREAMTFLQAKSEANTSIVVRFSAPFVPMVWYAPTLPVVAAVPHFPAQGQAVASQLAQSNLSDQVYVLDYLGELSDPYKTVDQTLSELSYQETDIYNFEGVGFIRLFVKQSHD